jgi:tetratricopeptide (TPR) repeat protein
MRARISRVPLAVLHALGMHSFARGVAMLLATVTLLMALFTYLNVKADGSATRNDTLTQTRSLEAATLEATGKTQVSFDWGEVYRTWQELDTAAASARLAGDEPEMGRLLDLRNAVRQESRLLSGIYFPKSTGLPGTAPVPDLPLYEVDLYYKQVQRLSEEAINLAEIKTFWDGQVNRYITVLAFLSAALFISGLALTVPRAVAGILVGLSVIMVLGGSTYGVMTYTRSEPRIPAAALDSYADGMAWWHLAANGKDRDQRSDDYELAIHHFSQALFFHDSYMNALTSRAEVHIALGLLNFGRSEGSGEQSLQAAVADYQEAQRRGLGDTLSDWNLGWVYYLLGRLDEAIAADQRALAADPTLFGVRSNLGVAYLANGQVDEGEREIMAATDDAAKEILAAFAAKQQPTESAWYYLESIAIDLDNLFLRMDGQDQPYAEAPPSRTVKDPAAVAKKAAELRDRASNIIVSLQETSKLPAPASAAARVTFRRVLSRPGQELSRYRDVPLFAKGTRAIRLEFDYEGTRQGQKVVWRVFRNGEQDRLLGRHRDWDLGTRGSGSFELSYEHTSLHAFNPGYYTVELFIDYQLAGRVSFVISDV